jgi:hypothetical protein
MLTLANVQSTEARTQQPFKYRKRQCFVCVMVLGAAVYSTLNVLAQDADKSNGLHHYSSTKQSYSISNTHKNTKC